MNRRHACFLFVYIKNNVLLVVFSGGASTGGRVRGGERSVPRAMHDSRKLQQCVPHGGIHGRQVLQLEEEVHVH